VVAPAHGARAWMSERAGHGTSLGTKPPSVAIIEGNAARMHASGMNS